MNIDEPTKFIKNVAAIIALVVAGWYGMLAIFATQEMVLKNAIEDIESDIDSGEKLRDHYQFIVDSEDRDLTKDEYRRFRVNGNKLDRLYADLDRKEQQLTEWAKR